MGQFGGELGARGDEDGLAGEARRKVGCGDNQRPAGERVVQQGLAVFHLGQDDEAGVGERCVGGGVACRWGIGYC